MFDNAIFELLQMAKEGSISISRFAEFTLSPRHFYILYNGLHNTVDLGESFVSCTIAYKICTFKASA